MWGRFLQWWHARSKKAQIGIAIGTILTFFILVAALSSGGDNGSSNEASPPPAAESDPPPSSEEEPPPPPPAATPQDRVRDEIGDTVDAPGGAGELEVRNVSFEGREAVNVSVTTPEGGLQGASCEDLDDGAQAVFAKVYGDAGWKGSTAVIYRGGLVDSSTGQDLPNATTGIFALAGFQARRIDWSDDDVLLLIDWSLYRDFCHPALKQ